MNDRMELDADGERFENRARMLEPISILDYLSWSITREANRTHIAFVAKAIRAIEENTSEKYFTL